MDDSRRDFLKKAVILSAATGASQILPASIQKAFAINPEPGSTYLDAEHIVLLMQENYRVYEGLMIRVRFVCQIKIRCGCRQMKMEKHIRHSGLISRIQK